MKYTHVVVLLAALLLVSCGSDVAPVRPSAPASSVALASDAPSTTVAPVAAASAAPSSQPAVSAAPSAAPAASADASSPAQPVLWQGLSISVPPSHRWEADQPALEPINDAQVIAQSQIAFLRDAATSPVEQPEGIRFTIVGFSGSLDQWLALEEARAASTNPIDRNTLRNTTVAGLPAMIYSYSVVGVSQSQTYIVKLDADRLLIINNSNADNPDYQTVITNLALTA